jgi:type VI secretion system secreted protein VgrG
VLEAGEEIHFKSGDKTVIDAGAEITLAAGGSFVKIDGGGVHMVGAAINLNAGGSPSAGSGFTGELPANAKTLTSDDKEHYLEIFHLDSELQPIENAKYRAVLSDGTEVKGVLDGDGYAKINGVSNGVATVYYETEQTFTDVPREAVGGVVNRLDSLLGE